MKGTIADSSRIRRLSILHLEDDPQDAELISEALREEGVPCQILRVSNGPEFLNALNNSRFDVIIADFNLPTMDGLEALKFARELAPGIPFILVTGSLGDDLAVETLKKGATDFVLKDRLARLGSAVRRAIVEHDKREGLKITRKALQESEEKYRSFVETTNDWIWSVDRQMKINYSSPATFIILGYDPQELFGLDYLSFMHPDDATRFSSVVKEAMKQKHGWNALVTRRKHRDTTYRYLESNAVPILDENNELIGFRGADRDITQRKLAEDELEKQNRFMQAVLENIHSGIIACDAQGILTFFNRAARDLHQRSVTSIGPEKWTEDYQLYLPDGKTPMEKDQIPLYRALQGEVVENAEMVIRSADGKQKAVLVTGQSIRDSLGQKLGAVVASHDITERKKAEEQLREAESKYRNLVERVPAIVYIAERGANGKWHYVSPRLHSILGFTAEEWMHDSALWYKQIFPEDRDQVLFKEQGSDRSFVVEYRMSSKEGKLVWFRDEAVILHRESETDLIQGIMIDISELKNAEQEKASLERELRHIQKIEAIGQLAGGVAHDFNNILMVISSYCELLQMKLEPDNPNGKFVAGIRTAAEQGSSLTRQLLAFSRKQKMELKILNLSKVLADLEGMLRRLIREDIELTMRLEESPHPVKADPAQIERLVINLVVNARDAMPNGGKLIIETSNVVMDEKSAIQLTEGVGGNHVLISVKDTGIGLDPQTLARIFEPFFTTKEEGKGTGLGLSTVYGIVKQSGGYIQVNSEPNKGTTFLLYFPKTQEI
jgi:two-component system cell cycle sensor histidine kinase/response regulator CckA